MSKENIRIAICSSGAGHVFRGVEKWSYDMAQLFRDKGVNHTFYKGGGVVSHPNEKVLWCIKRTLPLSRYLVKALNKIGGWRYGFGSEVHIEQMTFLIPLFLELRRHKYQIVHTQEYGLASYLESLRKRKLIKAKVILGHGTNESNEALMQFEYVQHLSPFELEMRKRESCYRQTWTAIPNFVNTSTYRPVRNDEKIAIRTKHGLPIETPILLTVAAIKREHKRMDWLVDELAILEKSCNRFLWLVVGGKEKETNEIIEMGNRRLGKKVAFLVDVPHDHMPDLYRCADLFILGSLREMFGIVLVEAMASGLPLFVHDHPVLKYVVGKGGIIVNMESHGSLSESLFRAIADSSSVERQSVLARSEAVKRFSEDIVFEQMMNYYRKVIADDF